MGKMFSFITCTWNPIAMRCGYDCDYCWSEALKNGRLKNTSKYKDLVRPYLVEREYSRNFKKDDFVFVEDMGDLFWEGVSDELVYTVLQAVAWISFKNEARVLILTKNPSRMSKFAEMLPHTALIGATIETNRPVLCSKAPPTIDRLQAMVDFKHAHKFICIEPIMDFDLDILGAWLLRIEPEIVAVGYDNYNHHLPEPSLEKTMRLIKALEDLGIKVEKKTLREPLP